MTKQEDIRDGIQAIIDGYDSTLPIDEPCPHCGVVDEILSYLHSQGVVIKVEGKTLKYKLDYPDSKFEGRRPNHIFAMGQTRRNNDMLKAGYEAVEPLM